MEDELVVQEKRRVLLAVCFVSVKPQDATPFRPPAILPASAITADRTPTTCDAMRRIAAPCRCCKLDCWHTIVDVVSHELGHVPGEEGDAEARATLQAVRSCMIAGCQKLCDTVTATRPPKARRRSPAVRFYEQWASRANALNAAVDAALA